MNGPLIIDPLETNCFCWLNFQCFSVKHKQSVFYIIFLPTNNMNDGKMVKMSTPGADRVRVAVRVRPFSQREKDAGSTCVVSMPSRTTTTIQDPKNPERTKTFTFDLAYWSHNGFQVEKDGVFTSADASSKFAGQREVFRDLGRGILDSAWQGYNATLLAYGQTGSGKSYSMIGFGANRGIVPSVCEELFQAIENQQGDQEYQVTFSMLEIYNEQVRDLLSRTKKPRGLKVREDAELGFYVDGLTSVPCENYAQVERLMEQGMKMRTTASTNVNASSSRSHMVITLQFKQVFPDSGLTKQSSINLVDLAGSERQKSSGSEGDRLREGSRVNLSLTNLGNVISALADAAVGRRVLHVPYRDSVLTKLLQAALGGNSRTTLIAAISPADICYEETLSTLRYAERAKKVRNKAVVNTATLPRESRAEHSKLLLGGGNCGMAGTLSPRQQPERPRGLVQNILALTLKNKNHFEIDVDSHAVLKKLSQQRPPPPRNAAPAVAQRSHFVQAAVRPEGPAAAAGQLAGSTAVGYGPGFHFEGVHGPQARTQTPRNTQANAFCPRPVERFPATRVLSETRPHAGRRKTLNAELPASAREDLLPLVLSELKGDSASQDLPSEVFLTRLRSSAPDSRRASRVPAETQPARPPAESGRGPPPQQPTWAHRLAQAREEWRQHHVAIAQERQMLKTLPHLLNVNEDPQLTGVLKYFIQAGSCDAGRAASNAITLQGLGISDKHASFTNLDGKVTVTPHSKCKVVVNGVPITTKTKLQHLDRVILGSNSAYLYVGFPSERGGEDLSRFDYDFFQLERAAAEGVSVDKLGARDGGDRQAGPSVLAVFQDYVKLMPLVAEANQMSEELRKGLKMELKVKNLASSDSRGYDLQKEVMVKVTNQRTHAVWIWSKAKFINRKFLMEELYQRFLDGEDSHVAQEDDPFWDPVEAVHLGSAHVWLQPLAYGLGLEEQVEFLDDDGLEAAALHVHVAPCSPAGQACGEEDVVIDPRELLGKRLDFQIRIVRCLGAKWLKEAAERGIQMGYRIYDLPHTLYTKPVWKIVNPQIEESVHFAALNTSQEFLSYLQTNALIVDLWGLQEGCAELSCSRQDLLVTGEGHVMVDTKNISTLTTLSQTPSNQISELYLKLLKLEQETDLLRKVNRALREENVVLRESLEKTGSSQHGERLPETWWLGFSQKPSDALKPAGMAAQLPAAPEVTRMCARRAGCDRELAKALKVFYQSMSTARGQLLQLRRCKPPEDDQMLRPFVHQQSLMLKDFGDLLESSLWKLKNDVALIVKKKRECLLQSE
ncbi:kinesin-like protein KIF28P [Pteronotus mesoamericanus]|uniref:kinesin-like protein KIF28P n=1 Tax=Pteronotus mesoamericanus TaxID=1884717 RepID=UPI0023ED1A83|nr:kinesin-like protein KIF28P [Pteronotus parnellii mesoamericanus]